MVNNYYPKSSIDRFILANNTSATTYSFTMPTTYATCIVISKYDVTFLAYTTDAQGVVFERVYTSNESYKLLSGSFSVNQILTLNFSKTMWGGITIFNSGA